MIKALQKEGAKTAHISSHRCIFVNVLVTVSLSWQLPSASN